MAESRETITVRVSKFFKDMVSSFSSNADKEHFIDLADEVAISYKFFKRTDIRLWPIFEDSYQKNKMSIPRIIFETLSCLSNYIENTQKEVTRFDLMQIDRWNIVVYYILSRAYIKCLRPESFNEKEKKNLSESEVCACYLFAEKMPIFEKLADTIIQKLDAYKFAYSGTYTWITALCIKNKEINVLMYNPDILFREKKLQEVLQMTLKDVSFGKYTPFCYGIKTCGFNNKILKILSNEDTEIVNELQFIDEIFINDLIQNFHNICSSNHRISYSVEPIRIFLIITKEIIKYLNIDISQEYYYMSNMIHHNSKNLPDAIDESLIFLETKKFLIDPEMWLRTPLQIIDNAIQRKHLFMHNPVIKTLIAQKIKKLVSPIYKSIVDYKGKIADFPIDFPFAGIDIRANTNKISLYCRYDKEKNYLLCFLNLTLDGVHVSLSFSMEELQILFFYLTYKWDINSSIKLQNNTSIINYGNNLNLSYQGVNFMIDENIINDISDVLYKLHNHENYALLQSHHVLHYGSNG